MHSCLLKKLLPFALTFIAAGRGCSDVSVTATVTPARLPR